MVPDLAIRVVTACLCLDMLYSARRCWLCAGEGATTTFFDRCTHVLMIGEVVPILLGALRGWASPWPHWAVCSQLAGQSSMHSVLPSVMLACTLMTDCTAPSVMDR